MRILALSDVHVDHPTNRDWVGVLSSQDYVDDTLILAGDVCHQLTRLATCLEHLREKFAEVFFVPGNHEGWLVRDPHPDSLAKIRTVLKLCTGLGVRTTPARVGEDPHAVWILPLHSWYTRPEEGPDSLYLSKPGEDPDFDGWGDDHFVRWPRLDRDQAPGAYFLGWNVEHLEPRDDAPVVTFSHFLPRQELIFELRSGEHKPMRDVRPAFNFSRFAGSKGIDEQLRRVGSVLHVHGHQHRNRHRVVDGVVYVSHCLGYEHERRRGQLTHLARGPKLVWHDGNPVRPSSEY